MAVGRADTSAPEATSFWALVLGSLGVVYGDIGTSPLYALKKASPPPRPCRPRRPHPRHGSRRRLADPLGADHHRDGQIRGHRPAGRQRGRGGTLSLVTLAQRPSGTAPVSPSCSAWRGRPCSTEMRSLRRPSRFFPRSRAQAGNAGFGALRAADQSRHPGQPLPSSGSARRASLRSSARSPPSGSSSWPSAG